MSFGHSFTEGFYYDEQVQNDAAPNKSKRPTSVAMALRSMPKKKWNAMCKDVFGCSPDFVDLDTVMDKIRETDTVGTLSVPVDVWIDEEGYYTVDVYDNRKD